MVKRLKTVKLVGVMLLAFFLLVAWYDGGKQEQRLIEQPVVLTETEQ